MVPTKYGVPALIGLGLLAATFAIFGLKVGIALAVLLVYEAWTLRNTTPEDTISETFWALSKRPLIPCLCGVAYGYALGVDMLNEFTSAVVAWLLSHFFFQAQMVYDYYFTKR